ncbi:hypothetical protein NA57DRAFT_34297 [Rhizodiscina lignyota]|uniref:Dynactin subunit 4 n=1 Tax=Rhizodiscina lignyota TaxID=1504668 RepID=A0A9P4IIB9_9PEZI|nr:hypothetical protein NA57DRAFT_34297 [Rhizodiscina lignyota]
MAQVFPYTYYSCPCVESSSTKPNAVQSAPQEAAPFLEDEEENTFDPRSPRANFSLYPIEHLLYCTDCHQIRCPRCMVEEVVCWYCPNCLFEVPSSTVRSDGNRCTRNCYNCPICTSILSISSLEKPTEGLTPNDAASDAAKAPGGPYFLSCPFCQWSSLEIGIQFEKHFNLTSQLQKIIRGDTHRLGSVTDLASPRGEEMEGEIQGRASVASVEDTAPLPIQGDTETLFTNLYNFYRAQLSELSDANPYSLSSDYSFASPSSITRLMNLYGSGGRTKKDRPKPIREAAEFSEGQKVSNPLSEKENIDRIRSVGWEGTASVEQRLQQCREDVGFVDELRPLATLLRTKKSKRCKICRQILSRPESKVSTNRYKIKLLALNNIPKITMRSLNAQPAQHPSFPMQATAPGSDEASTLKPLVPTHFLLTITNPLFDSIKVTLATPSTTPGCVKSKVTILCPQFDVGANTDVWDEALSSATDRSSKRQSQMLSAGPDGGSLTGIQAEAGKVWERGRNWTSIVVEVAPGSLPDSIGHVTLGDDAQGDGGAALDEDEDVLEIPIFVRLEYETEAGGDDGGAAHARKEDAGKEKREEAFWAVLGVGRIAG